MTEVDYSNLCAAFTLFFGNRIEGYSNIENIGEDAPCGFTNNDILRIYSLFPENCELHNLKDMLPPTLYDIPDVLFLVIKNPFKEISDQLLQILMTEEQRNNDIITGVNWDTVKYKGGQVKESKEKYRLIFTDLYDGYIRKSFHHIGYGTIYNYRRIPQLVTIKSYLELILLGPFVIEANCYVNKKDCYIPMHRDKERKRLCGIRLGGDFPINFRWHHGSIRCSDVKSINLSHGDVFIMSELATGYSKEKITKLFLKYSEGTHGNSVK